MSKGFIRWMQSAFFPHQKPVIKTTGNTTCYYNSHTSNDGELPSSCWDLDTVDDLLAEVLNQNKESFSPKIKKQAHIDLKIAWFLDFTLQLVQCLENGSSCQTQFSSLPTTFIKDWEQDPVSKMLCFFLDMRQHMKSRNPVNLSVTHQLQNPLEEAKYWCIKYMKYRKILIIRQTLGLKQWQIQDR
jgi:hypothetical protein